MQVGFVRQLLAKYSDDEQIIIEFWGRDTVSEMLFGTDGGEALTTEQWERIVRSMGFADEADSIAIEEHARTVLQDMAREQDA